MSCTPKHAQQSEALQFFCFLLCYIGLLPGTLSLCRHRADALPCLPCCQGEPHYTLTLATRNPQPAARSPQLLASARLHLRARGMQSSLNPWHEEHGPPQYQHRDRFQGLLAEPGLTMPGMRNMGPRALRANGRLAPAGSRRSAPPREGGAQELAVKGKGGVLVRASAGRWGSLGASLSVANWQGPEGWRQGTGTLCLGAPLSVANWEAKGGSKEMVALCLGEERKHPEEAAGGDAPAVSEKGHT